MTMDDGFHIFVLYDSPNDDTTDGGTNVQVTGPSSLQLSFTEGDSQDTKTLPNLVFGWNKNGSDAFAVGKSGKRLKIQTSRNCLNTAKKVFMHAIINAGNEAQQMLALTHALLEPSMMNITKSVVLHLVNQRMERGIKRNHSYVTSCQYF